MVLVVEKTTKTVVPTRTRRRRRTKGVIVCIYVLLYIYIYSFSRLVRCGYRGELSFFFSFRFGQEGAQRNTTTMRSVS